MRLVTILAALLALAVAIAVGVALLVVDRVPLDQLRAPLQRLLSDALGGPVEIRGALGLDLGLQPRLTAEDITVGDPPGGEVRLSGKLRRAELALDLAPLLEGHVEFVELRLVDGAVRIETDDRERPPEGAKAPPAEPPESLALRLERVVAENVEITHHDVGTGATETVLLERVKLAARDAEAPLSVDLAGRFREFPFELTGSLGSLGRFRTKTVPFPVDLEGTVASLSVALRGSLERPDDLEGIDLALSASAETIDRIPGLPSGLPAIGPLKASARLTDADGSLGLEGIEILLGREGEPLVASARGRMDDLGALHDIDLGVKLSLQSLALLDRIAERELPRLGPLSLAGRLTDLDGSVGAEDVELRLGGTGRDFELIATGSFDDVRALDEIEFALRARAATLSSLDPRLPERGPFEFDGRVRGSDEHIAAREVRGRLGRTAFSGDASGSFAPGRRPTLEASVHTPRLYLEDLGITPQENGGGETGPSEPWRLPADWPELDAAVSLRIDAIQGTADLFVQEFELDLLLEEGHVAVQHLKGRSADGAFTGELHLYPRESPPRVTLRSDLENVRIHELLAQVQKVPAVTANLHGRIDLTSRGSTLEELRSALTGDFVVVTEDGTASTAYVRALERDLLRAFIDRGWKTDREFERIDCFIADFRAEAGIARSEALWLETDRVIIDGGGSVDVGRGTLDLTFAPAPKRPGPVSLAARVSVTGPWEHPVVRTDKASVVESAARALFSNLTRAGDPLLKVVWRRQPSSKNHCAEALAPE